MLNKVNDPLFDSNWEDLVCNGGYDAGEGEGCRAAMNDADCEAWTEGEWREACRDVYGCSG